MIVSRTRAVYLCSDNTSHPPPHFCSWSQKASRRVALKWEEGKFDMIKNARLEAAFNLINCFVIHSGEALPTCKDCTEQ